MRKSLIGVLGLIISMVAALAVMAMGQRAGERGMKLSDTKEGLQLSIGLDAESYRSDDVATLKIKLKNISQVPIAIFRKFGWGPSSSFFLSISDERGKEIEKTAFADASHWPPFLKEDFITLQPGESVEHERELDLEGEGIKAPGLYEINLWYRSPIRREYEPEGMKLWSTENGKLQAKPITLKLTR